MKNMDKMLDTIAENIRIAFDGTVKFEKFINNQKLAFINFYFDYDKTRNKKNHYEILFSYGNIYISFKVQDERYFKDDEILKFFSSYSDSLGYDFVNTKGNTGVTKKCTYENLHGEFVDFVLKTYHIFYDFFVIVDNEVALNNPVPDQYDNKNIIADCNIFNNGLADKIRGILSLYEVSKEFGYNFFINFTSPFNLNDYLHIKEKFLPKNDLLENSIITRYVTARSNFNIEQFKNYIRYRCEKYKNIRIGCNHIYNHENYQRDFYELFEPSDEILKEVEVQKKNIGGNYISVSFRFLNYFNDFKDEQKIKPGTEEEQLYLLAKCRNAFRVFQKKFPSKTKILLNSDSVKFLKFMSDMENVYIVPGEIAHSGFKQNKSAFTKLFLDFFLIMGADKICRFEGRNVYPTAFPWLISRCAGKTFYTYFL